jgi:hypothetical protein
MIRSVFNTVYSVRPWFHVTSESSGIITNATEPYESTFFDKAPMACLIFRPPRGLSLRHVPRLVPSARESVPEVGIRLPTFSRLCVCLPSLSLDTDEAR